MPHTVPVQALVDAVGAAAVDTDPEALVARSHDVWPVAVKWARQGHHPHPADAVVHVRSADAVAAVLRIASEAGVAVTPWGRGSSVTGQALPVEGGIVLDVSGLTGEPELDETDLTVTAAAGVLGGELETWVQARGYTLGHSPQSLHRSSVGGWVATLATGQFSSRYGGIEDLAVRYTVILADGSQATVGARPRAAMGPDLRHLFLGSEGTLGVVVEVVLKVFPLPETRRLEAFTLPDVPAGLAVLRELMALGLRPFLVRLYDTDEARVALHDERVEQPVLFLGSEGQRAVAEAEHSELTRLVTARGGHSLGAGPVDAWMGRRFDFSAIERVLDRDGGYAETIEVAHLWSGIGGLYDALKHELAPLADSVLGHFSHVYTQGTSLYVILLGQAEDDAAAQARLEAIWETAMAVCLRQGAELSHHHGGGLARSRYAAESLGDAHPVLQRIKDALDPRGVLNPGKLGLRTPQRRA